VTKPPKANLPKPELSPEEAEAVRLMSTMAQTIRKGHEEEEAKNPAWSRDVALMSGRFFYVSFPEIGFTVRVNDEGQKPAKETREIVYVSSIFSKNPEKDNRTDESITKMLYIQPQPINPEDVSWLRKISEELIIHLAEQP